MTSGTGVGLLEPSRPWAYAPSLYGMTSSGCVAGLAPSRQPAPGRERCSGEEVLSARGEESKDSEPMRNPLPRALPTLGLSPHRMESSGFDHTRRHCEGHLVHPADPLSFGHGDGGPIILGGAVGPPAVVRKQTAKLKRDCAARVAAGEASLVPLLWADGLGCVGADSIEWAEAYGADETDVPPVAHFCAACSEHYAIRREVAGCARCGVEFKVAGLVRGGRSELVLDQLCVMC